MTLGARNPEHPLQHQRPTWRRFRRPLPSRTLKRMTSPDTDKPFAEVLAEHGRPVTAEGLDRARDRLAEAAERRDPDARAELLARLHAAA